MAALVWVMVGIALWHFTIFLPDHFWAGIVGAFPGAVFGALLFGLVIHGFNVPGNDDVSILNALEAVPGTALGLGFVYWLGLRQERNEQQHQYA